MLQEFKVGHEFKYVKDYDKYRNIEGVIMECEADGGFSLIFYLPNMTLQEKEMLRSAKIVFKALEDKEKGYILTLVKIGKLIFEIEFDPTLYHDQRQSIETLTFGNAMHVFGVDSKTNILQSIRMIGLYDNLIKIWGAGWLKMIENKDGGYKKWVTNWHRFNLDALWEMAGYVCQFPEKKL